MMYFAVIPYSVEIQSTGVSANYLYLLIALGLVLARRSLVVPNLCVMVMLFWSMGSILVGIFSEGFIYYPVRMIASWLLFISVFLFAFVRLKPSDVIAFKQAIVLASIIMASQVMYSFFSQGGNDLQWSAKTSVGSQRYGFMYLFSLCILLAELKLFRFRLLSAVFSFVLLCGIFLTFSRSSIVTLIVVLLLVLNLELPRVKFGRGSVLLGVFGIVVVTIGMMKLFPTAMYFYDQTLFSLTTDNGSKSYDFNDPNASEGYRMVLWGKILESSLESPWFGSHFLGVWSILDEGGAGSAHSQYFDILFRGGVLGLLIYMSILFGVGSYLFKRDAGLFYGFLAVCVYGLFHTSFKESQGAVILAILIGVWVSDSLRATRDSAT